LPPEEEDEEVVDEGAGTELESIGGQPGTDTDDSGSVEGDNVDGGVDTDGYMDIQGIQKTQSNANVDRYA
jgi:hypothetical protein